LDWNVNVENFNVVLSFTRDDAIVLTCGPQLKEAQRRFGGQLFTVNVPDKAPPSLPRLVLRLDNALLHVGLDRFEFVTEPPRHVAGVFGEALDFAQNRVVPILELLLESGVSYEWTGVVANIEYPEEPRQSASAREAVAPLVQRLVRLDWQSSDLRTFNLQIGRIVDGYLRNYTFSGYEVRNLEPTEPTTPTQSLTEREGALVEVGIQVSLDVNNKLSQEKSGPIADLGSIIVQQAHAFGSLANDFNLQELL
jgi:hypothetical protein